MIIERKLEERGLILPAQFQSTAGVIVPFVWVRIFGDRAHVSGHGPQNPDGSPAGPFGKVGGDVSPEDAYAAARLATLALLGSIKRAIGDLDRIAAWLTISGHIAVAPGFNRTTNVMNGCSDLVHEIFGETVGMHARTAIGVAELPLGLPVVIAAEVALTP